MKKKKKNGIDPNLKNAVEAAYALGLMDGEERAERKRRMAETKGARVE